MANDVVFIGAIFALICIGLYCVTQKSMIRILLGVELMLNAGNLALVYFASYRIAAGFVDPLGQSLAFMSIILGGSTIAVGLALVVNAYKQFKTTEVDKMRRLKW
ncbi:MAG: NADH-quinone oxidoreductase subunit NuoK [Candidatus Bathyarchaeota archaeon]|nr:NADH-quinone oxidoreductase subunit NuoK [Candidatus Bathyarchaeota archaeon]